jgi:hypothetical protein
MTQTLFAQPPQKREARMPRLFFGVLILFVLTSIPVIPMRPVSAAYALGRLIGALMFAVPAVWLIVSGLPKTMGLNAVQRPTLRIIWYRYVGIGLLTMAALFFLFSYRGWPVMARLVNLVYWIGWTWVSWIIADNKSGAKDERGSAAANSIK